ncbi:glycosyltransferase [Vibrio fluvialis]|uniref:glycosyltransferase n=1 Tax=Vibrio fluvialis TaxID=676 RepID=UPI0024DF8499|nr:glycosyltransferase [Vibrio fluvialis]WIE03922.1 glycosyltransferase [Vibrio fluvialis]
MKILHAVESLDSSYGGPANSVTNLCAHLNALDDINTVLFSLDDDTSQNLIIDRNNLTWYRKKSFGFSKLKYSYGLIEYLKKLVQSENVEIIHVHNLWNYFSYACYKVAKDLDIPLVFSIRGSLYPWSLSQRSLLKKAAWFLFQKRALLYCKKIHVTCIDEKSTFSRLVNNENVMLIPNGVEFPEQLLTQDKAKEKLNLDIDSVCFLFLSRVHPKKGIDYLLRALMYLNKPVTVLIVGPVTDVRYDQSCKKLSKNLPSNIKVKFVSEVSSEKKWDYYSACDLFILPSQTENFGIVIAEALISGKPVLTTNNTPWDCINSINAGYCVPLNDANIIASINDFLLHDKLTQREMGSNGATFVKSNFAWESIAAQMLNEYQELMIDR